jgi:hypothetical protein
MRRIIAISTALAMLLATFTVFLATVPMVVVADGSTETIEVTQPIQVTTNSYYERGQSIVFDGSDYWMFYGRSDSETGNYQNEISGDGVDGHNYKVYYKTAESIADLPSATATLISCSGNQNGYLGETGAAYFGGEVWAFATIDVGSTAEVYGWYHDGTNWNEVSSMVTGLSDGAAHHEEVRTSILCTPQRQKQVVGVPRWQ